MGQEASRRRLSAAWASYAVVGTVGYVLYGLGAVGPYLRTQLRLSDAEVGLHSTALAIGLIVAGAVVGGLGRRFGEVAVRGAAIAIVALAVVALAIAPSVLVTLAAGLAIGVGLGTILGYANATMGAAGETLARLRLARANVWAMVAAFVAPVVLAIGATAGPGWWLGLVPAFALLAVNAVDLREGPRLTEPLADGRAIGHGRLPRGFWLAWVFLIASIAAEFSIVFWGATLVERRTGVSTAEATVIGALFLAGMFAGRLALSAGIGAGRGVRLPAAVGLVLAVVGVSLAWVSMSAPLSGVALFVAGTGIAGLYPLGVSAALAAAPGQLALAGTRLNLASGLAILVAPLALGAVADLTGVVVGWGLVVLLVFVALALVGGLPSQRRVDANATTLGP